MSIWCNKVSALTSKDDIAMAERVYDLAHDVSELLRAYRRAGAGTSKSTPLSVVGQVVYLATTTTDVQDERDRIRRE